MYEELAREALSNGHVEAAQVYALLEVADAIRGGRPTPVVLAVGNKPTAQEVEELRSRLEGIEAFSGTL